MDNNKIGVFNSNNIVILEDYALIDLYDKFGNVVAQCIIDIEDMPKAKLYKWRATKKRNKLYVVTGNQKSEILYYARFILNYSGDKEVDHIDGNSLNNRKYNLRIIDKPSNCLNMQRKINNQSGIRGISYDSKNNKYVIDFSYKKKRLYFKPIKILEEAVYLRYLCEKYILKEYRNESNDDNYNYYVNKLSKEQKDNIYKYFLTKINDYEMVI